MQKEIFINESMGETRIAIQESNQLVEVYVEKQDNHRMVGNVYKGVVDKPLINNNFDTKLAVLEGTSPMSDLDMVRSFMTSKAGMDQRSASDTSFDEIFDDKQITVKWGKV